jgi:hypothetical protein
VISGAFNNKSVYFLGVIIMQPCLGTANVQRVV